MAVRAPQGFPKPTRNEAYGAYTARAWRWVKRTKPRTFYTGQQQKAKRQLKPGAFPRVTACIAMQWRRRPKAWH